MTSPGVYSVALGWGWNNQLSAGRREFAITVNGDASVGETVPGTMAGQFQSTSMIVRLGVDDTIKALVVQDSGASIDPYADNRARLAIQRIAN